MADFLRGRFPALKPLPKEIREFMIVKNTGWTLEYVRSLPYRDYRIMDILGSIYDNIKRQEEKKKSLSI